MVNHLTNPPTKSLRICHLAKYYYPFRGGIETHVRSLALAQTDLYSRVTVACVNHLDESGNDVWCSRTARTPSIHEQDEEVEVLRFGKFGTLARFDFCRGIHSFLKSAHFHYDLLHLHVPNPAMCVWLATAKPKVPLVITYHSDIVKQKWIRKPFQLIEKRVFNHASQLIASSPDYRDASEVLARYLDKTMVIPFGIDGRPYENPSAEAEDFAAKLRRRTADEPLWLCVGRLVYYKGTEIAIRALPNCRGRLMIVGAGPLQESLEQLAQKLGVSDRIDWYSNLSDDELVGAFHAATALWFPSVMRSEAFGLVQLEAMASGCPIINTAIPHSGVSWVSQDGVSGITIPVGCADTLARAANRIDQEPEVAAELSSGATARFSELFSLEAMVEKTDRLYSKMLMRPSQTPVAQRASILV